MRSGHQISECVKDCTDACQRAGEPAGERRDTFKKTHSEGSLAPPGLFQFSRNVFSTIGRALNILMGCETPRAG